MAGYGIYNLSLALPALMFVLIFAQTTPNIWLIILGSLYLFLPPILLAISGLGVFLLKKWGKLLGTGVLIIYIVNNIYSWVKNTRGSEDPQLN